MVMKWSWARQAKKLHVKVRPLKLEGVNPCCKKNEDGLVVVKLKWNGPKSGLVPFQRVSTCQRSYSAHKLLKKGELLCVEWDDEFESICDFFIGSSKDGSFCYWNVSFHVLYGEDAESKTKLVVLGKVSLNIAEFASKMDRQIEKRLPVSLQIDGAVTEANLLISLSFVEVRNSNETNDLPVTASKSRSLRELDELSVFKLLADRSIDHNEELSVQLEQSTSTETRSDPASKAGLFSWKKRKLNFGLSTKKAKPLVDLDNHGPAQDEEKDVTSSWEVKELVSRDGKAKLRTNVFFASYDQRSEKAAGESACTALVVVIAHWLQSNRNLMPSTSQFDSLITEGSSLWRKLCDNNAYTDAFPDKHFDLDTVIKADLRPVTIMHDHSFTGMFSPEKFENSKGSFMAFDNIWEEINGCIDVYDLPKIYIVSWNDHFFVLKVEADAYYIIDSLGERLFEGCNQAYILKFDKSSLMSEKVAKETDGSEEASEAESSKEDIYEETFKGKDCCREFIKRFLAAVLLGELEEEEKKRPVSTVSLLQRLQIDFNYCSPSSASSSSFSLSSATSSLFPGEG